MLDERRSTVRSVSFESLEATHLAPERAAAYAADASHEVVIAVGRATIAVRFSRASAAAGFAERFADMLGNRPPAAVVYAVARDGEAYFWQSPDRVRRWPEDPSDELLTFFADSVALHEYLTRSTVLGIHAAAIANAAQLVALVGVSAAGKTTTAIAAIRRGFALYSDERCIIEDGRVVSFLRAVTIREGARRALVADALSPNVIDARLRELPARGDATIPPGRLVGGSAGGPPRPLGALFIIEGHGSAPSVEACSLYAALPALLKSMVSADTGIARAERLLRDLRAVPVYRLRLGTPDATAAAIERTLA